MAPAFTPHVAGRARSADAHVHRALTRLGDLADWTARQVDKGTLTAAQGVAVRALIARVGKGV
jgi:hypothetical protein